MNLLKRFTSGMLLILVCWMVFSPAEWSIEENLVQTEIEPSEEVNDLSSRYVVDFFVALESISLHNAIWEKTVGKINIHTCFITGERNGFIHVPPPEK